MPFTLGIALHLFISLELERYYHRIRNLALLFFWTVKRCTADSILQANGTLQKLLAYDRVLTGLSLLDSTSDSSFESLGSDMDEAVGGQQDAPANDRRPAWLGEILAAVHQQTTQIQQQATRIEGLENLARGNMMEGVTSNPPITGNGPVKRPRHEMDDEKFDGIDLSLYPQFEGLLYAKLEIDSEAIGNEKEKVWYGFSRLNEGAAGRISIPLDLSQ